MLQNTVAKPIAVARPSQPIQRRPNGMYFVRLRGADGKRLTKSLETRDAVVAAKRAHEALEELQSIIDGPSQHGNTKCTDTFNHVVSGLVLLSN